MAEVTFYEKPGCAGNARQKKLLAAAGHTIVARDLRSESWTSVKLMSFFSSLPIADWFNRNAPAVKSGEIVPETLNESTAIALLIDNPLLIRRPLLQVGDERLVGFDTDAVSAWIGLGDAPPGEDMEACRAKPGESCASGLPEAGQAEDAVEFSFAATVGGGAMPFRNEAEPQHGHTCRCGK